MKSLRFALLAVLMSLSSLVFAQSDAQLTLDFELFLSKA